MSFEDDAVTLYFTYWKVKWTAESIMKTQNNVR